MEPIALAGAVYDFTFSVMNTLADSGLLPAITAVGNELSNGLLWPFGRTPNFENIVLFLNAGIQAVRDAAPGIKIMLHLDNGGNNTLYRTWFDSYFASGGKDFDYIGLSYYPFWHGTMDDLKNNMQDLALRYHKDMIVAEVSTGFTLEDYASYEKLASEERKGMATKRELAEKVPYPMTPEGQSTFMLDIMKLIRDVPENRGKGLRLLGACVAASPRLRLGERSRTGLHRRTRPRRQRMGQSGIVRLRRERPARPENHP